MIVMYLRSSAIGTHEMCEMKYFFQYVLGMKDKTNKKAVMGTIFHRAMQALADKKLAQKSNKKKLKNDDIRDLTFAECDNIPLLTELCFEYYAEHEDVSLTKADLRTCTKWVQAALDYNGGIMDPRNQDIFATEQFFDIEIPHDWAKYDYKVGDKTFSGQLSIKGTVDLILKENDAYFQILDYKGLPIETPILTTNGWSTMGDINIGDVVYDRFGRQTKVMVKSRVKDKECYRITFDDNSIAECDDEHYWTLCDNTVVQSPNIEIGMKIDVAKPLENEEISLPVHPYVLGLWLGDGRNRCGEICCGDLEVFDRIKSLGYSLGENTEKRTTSCQSRTVYGLTTLLRNLNLLNNKHIPEIYFNGSIEQRTDLLKGLMDSDGSVNTLRKQCVLMNRNKKLSEDITFLLRTLGQRPYLCNTKQKYKEKIIECYPVFFRPINISPFNIERKSSKINSSWGNGLSSVRRVVKIEKIGKKKTQCISVDSPDMTYLCTKNLIPTHNTGKRLNWATGKEKTLSDLYSDKQLLLYYYAMKNLFPEKSFYISIFYLNDGGLFDIVFADEAYAKAEKMLKSKFEELKRCQVPKQLSQDQTDWKCTRLCQFSDRDPETGLTVCQNFHNLVKRKGMDYVVENYANLNKLGKYGSGGGRIDTES